MLVITVLYGQIRKPIGPIPVQFSQQALKPDNFRYFFGADAKFLLKNTPYRSLAVMELICKGADAKDAFLCIDVLKAMQKNVYDAAIR